MTDPNELPIEPSEKGPAEPSHRNTEGLNLRVPDKTQEAAQGSAQATVETSETLAGEFLDDLAPGKRLS